MLNKIVIFVAVVFLSLSLYPGKKPPPEKKNKNNPSTENTIIEEVEVVGEIARNKTIQSVTVYSEDLIKSFSGDGLKSILNHSPGFLVLNGGHYGQIAYSFARGASVNQTLYLINGFKITDPSNSIGLNTTFFSPYLIEKVEIVRGPLSNIFGSNAMGGVVNLLTREKNGTEVTLFFGSHGTYEGGIYFSKEIKKIRFTLTGNWQHYSDGIDNDDFSNKGISVKTGYKNDKLNTNLIFFGNFADSGIPLYLNMPTPNRQYSQNNYILALPFTFKFDHNTKINLKLSHHYNRYEFQDPDDTWTPYFMNKAIINEVEISFKTDLFNILDLYGGIDFSDQKIHNEDNTEKQLDDEKTNYISAYFTSSLYLKKLHLSGSIRYDKYKNINQELSPQLGFTYRLFNWLNIRSSFSQSFRAPTLPELLNPYWGNPELKPEKGKSFEVGTDIYLKNTTLSLVYFNSKYKNLIGYSPLTWTFENLNEAVISGIEISISVSLFEQVVLHGAYTYLDTHDVQYDRELLRRPNHSFSTFITYKNRYFSISGEMIYVGDRLDYDELIWDVGENPSFNTFNFNLQVPINKKLFFIGKATNAFNHKYQEVLGYPAPGNRFLVGLKYRIN